MRWTVTIFIYLWTQGEPSVTNPDPVETTKNQVKPGKTQ